MDKPTRAVKVTIRVEDRPDAYNSTERGTATRVFPANTPPADIGKWAARTAFGQIRDAQASYPLVADEPNEEAVLAKPATEASETEAESVVSGGGDLEDLPF